MVGLKELELIYQQFQRKIERRLKILANFWGLGLAINILSIFFNIVTQNGYALLGIAGLAVCSFGISQYRKNEKQFKILLDEMKAELEMYKDALREAEENNSI